MNIVDYKKKLVLDDNSILNRKTESPKIDALINLLHKMASYTGLFTGNSIKLDHKNPEQVEKAKDVVDAILYFSKIYSTQDYNIFCYVTDSSMVNPLSLIEITYAQQFKGKIPYAYDYELILKSLLNLMFDVPIAVNVEKILEETPILELKTDYND